MRAIRSFTVRAKLPDALAKDVAQAVNDWRAGGRVRRLWQRDASLWTNADESQWLGWLQFAFSSYLEMHEGEPIAKVGNSVEANFQSGASGQGRYDGR